MNKQHHVSNPQSVQRSPDANGVSQVLPKRFNPEALILAREVGGVTQKALAAGLGVTQGFISKIEDGVVATIADDLVEKFAALLSRPVSFFYLPGQRRAMASSFFRKRSQLPASVLNRANALMNISRIRIEQLVENTEIDARELPYIDPVETDGGPSGVARMMRLYWRVASGPVSSIVEILEESGIVVQLMDFGTRKIDGVSFFSNEATPIIFLNKNIPFDRLRFTAMHEVGHLVMHRVPSATMEEEANEFAAEFLMPEAEILSSLYPVNIDHLCQLKLRWKVSMAALLHRASQLGVISETAYRGLWIQMSRFGFRTNEPYEDQIPAEVPTLLSSLIDTHILDLEYTREDLKELLGASDAEFDEMWSTEPEHPFLKVLPN